MAYKWLVKDWETFFPALEQAQTEKDVAHICEEEIAGWRSRPTLKKESSLRVAMTATRNEIQQRLSGEVRAWALEHLAFSTDWYKRHNAPGRAVLEDRLEHQKLLQDPDAIVSKAVELLASEAWPEVAVGIAVCTGRRPGEVLKTAVFEPKTMYSVVFSGQLKRRDDPLPPYEIPTLCKASAVIDALKRLRTMLDTSEMEVRDVTQKYSSLVQEAANKHFASLVPARHGKDGLYGHLFRSVYPRIAVFWYCPTTIADVHFMATIQGHTQFFEGETEEARRSYASSAHYFDYKIADQWGNIDGRQGVRLGMEGVELLEIFKPKRKEKKVTATTEDQPKGAIGKNYPVTVKGETYNRVLALRKGLGHRVYDETIQYLLDALEQGGRARLDPEKLTPENLVPVETAAMIREAMEVSGEESFMAFLTDALTKEAKFRTSLSKRHADKDFTTLPTSQLAKTKHPGATKERIRRAIAAIVAYNDNAPSPMDRWYINATTVQHLSGARFPIVKEYFAEHQAEIDAENAEHDLNARYNHKPVRIEDVVTIPENV